MQLLNDTENTSEISNNFDKNTLLSIISFFSDGKTLRAFALACKKHANIVKSILDNPEIFKPFSLNLFKILIRNLDNSKELQTLKTAIEKRQMLCTELDKLSVIRERNPQTPSQFLNIALWQPVNNDLTLQVDNSYSNINRTLSTGSNASSITNIPPRQLNMNLQFLFSLGFFYFLYRKHLPTSLNISNYLPQEYSLLVPSTLLILFLIAVKLNLSGVITSSYAQQTEANLTQLTRQPLSPATSEIKTLIIRRNKMHDVLVQKSDSNSIQDLPTEVYESVGLKKIQ